MTILASSGSVIASSGSVLASGFAPMAQMKGGIVSYENYDDQARRAYIAGLDRRLSEIYLEDDEKMLSVIVAFTSNLQH